MGLVRRDFVVIGGGPAGIAFALSAVAAGATVTLIERTTRSFAKTGEILPSTIAVPLAELGLWSAFKSRGYYPSHGTVSVWHENDPVERSQLFDPYGDGWLIDRSDFERWLRSVAQVAGGELRRSRAVRLERTGTLWVVHLGHHDGERIAAPMIVEATGRGRGVVGHGARMRDDALVGLVAYIHVGEAYSDARLYLEAVAGGWWYSAPIPGNRVVLALMTDAHLVPARREDRQVLWLRSLGASRLSRTRVVDVPGYVDVRVHPANGSMRRTIAGDNWLAIGDAAATYDPLCGQGIVTALSKGIAAARLLTHGPSVTRAISDYVDTEKATFDRYRQIRCALYRTAEVVPSSPFWDERCSRYAPTQPRQL
jgi:flavin-dependent dehydrogenase